MVAAPEAEAYKRSRRTGSGESVKIHDLGSHDFKYFLILDFVFFNE